MIWLLILGLWSGPSPERTGTIYGKVLFNGSPPPRTRIQVKGDACCEAFYKGKVLYAEDFVLNKNGTLKWCLIYLTKRQEARGMVQGPHPERLRLPALSQTLGEGNLSSLKPNASPTKVILDQRGCVFRPHVFGIVVGQPLVIQNSDNTFHNIRAMSRKNRSFNIAQPTKGAKNTKVFTQSEQMIQFSCNVHNWMRAYCAVFDHPYFAVTDETGSFIIPKVAPGKYTVEVWHEKLGKLSSEVTVKAGKKSELNYTYKR